MNPMRYVELLSPAKDYDAARAAVDHGADAIYMGAARFGARRAAANSLEDVARTLEYAHQYGVRVHSTLNTVLYDDELADAERMARELIGTGIDALIVQDMALRQMNLPVELHASTQAGTVTPEQALFLEQCGFSRVILERALTLEDIRRIREATFVESRRTSQIDVLVELAAESDINPAQFIDEYTYGDAQADFMQDRMKCRRNGITGFPSYLVSEGNTNIILGGYQNLRTFHTVISRLSGGKIKPRRIGPSLANIIDFAKHYKSFYPAEIETTFSLDRAQTDAMISELLQKQRLSSQTIGDGRKLTYITNARSRYTTKENATNKNSSIA